MRKLQNKELKRISSDEFRITPKTPIILVLDNVRSAMNIGSVFRTADAFLIEKIYLCGICAIPPNKELIKTALGSDQSVDWEYAKETTDIVQQLKKEGATLVAIEQTEHAIPLPLFNPNNKKIAMVFGHEIFGINQEVINLCDVCVEIPQFGTKHSLNIAVSAGIAIWETWRKLQ